MTDVLDDVQSWMTFFGWTDGGAPGSVKHDSERRVIARHGTAQWVADVEDACERIDRARALAELERRERERT